MDKYTLIPSAFFSGDTARGALEELYRLEATEEVKYTELPSYEAVLVFAVPGGQDDDRTPVAAELLQVLPLVPERDKIVASYSDGWIHIAVAQGDRLLLANSYAAADTVTAQYFIFAVLNQFQINPEMTAIYFREKLDFELQETLLEYFRAVESISVLYNQ